MCIKKKQLIKHIFEHNINIKNHVKNFRLNSLIICEIGHKN